MSHPRSARGVRANRWRLGPVFNLPLLAVTLAGRGTPTPVVPPDLKAGQSWAAAGTVQLALAACVTSATGLNGAPDAPSPQRFIDPFAGSVAGFGPARLSALPVTLADLPRIAGPERGAVHVTTRSWELQ